MHMKEYKFDIKYELVLRRSFTFDSDIVIETSNEYLNSEQISECLSKYLNKNEDEHYSNFELIINKIFVPQLK